MMGDSALSDRDLPANSLDTIANFRLSRRVHYHRGHTWVHLEHDGDIRMGVDDFGQWLLGTVRHVLLPGTGDAVFEGAPTCELRLDTGRIGVLAPISGRVMARNQRLLEQPGLVNKSPYDEGWLLVVKPSDLPLELGNLLRGEEAARWLDLEIGRLKERFKGDRTHWRDDLIEQLAGEFMLAEMKKAA
jgi:glycine cleavage system H protein